MVSSKELGEDVGVSSAQIRKDLSYFGEFGKQGLGYEIDYLREQIERILHVDQDRRVVIVGAGALGHALANYRTFEDRRYFIVGVFDNDPAKIGQPIGDLTVQSIDEMGQAVEEHKVEIGILAIPASAAPAGGRGAGRLRRARAAQLCADPPGAAARRARGLPLDRGQPAEHELLSLIAQPQGRQQIARLRIDERKAVLKKDISWWGAFW